MTEENKLGLVDLDLERFRIHSRDEVLRVLRDLARDRQLISAYFNAGEEFLLTTVLAIDERHDRLLLDDGPDLVVNERLIGAGEAVAVSTHRSVRVQFRMERMGRAEFDAAPALACALPESLVRVQRREYYRLVAPVSSRLRCRFKSEAGELVEASVVDISIGGLGLIEPGRTDSFKWDPGTVVREVRLELPGGEIIEADMEIRNRFAVDRNGNRQYRVGCMFLNIDNRQSAAIQRYIHRTELERRRLLQG